MRSEGMLRRQQFLTFRWLSRWPTRPSGAGIGAERGGAGGGRRCVEAQSRPGSPARPGRCLHTRVHFHSDPRPGAAEGPVQPKAGGPEAPAGRKGRRSSRLPGRGAHHRLREYRGGNETVMCLRDLAFSLRGRPLTLLFKVCMGCPSLP